MTNSALVDRLHGIIPPVITPLSDNGEFDRASAETLYRHLLDCGVHGLFLFGSSGEGPWLSESARLAAMDTARRVAGGRVPLLVGALAPATDAVVEQARQAQERGADAVVVCPPFYFRATQSEVIEHFRAIHRAVSLPVVAYDIPVTTQTKIELGTMLELAREATIVAAKDSSSDAAGFRRLLVRRPAQFRLFTGSELLVDAVLLAGADGAVPGLANVAPELFVELYDHWRAGRLAEAAEVQDRITRLFEVFVCPDGAIRAGYAIGSMKAAMRVRGVIASTRLCRPFSPVTVDHEERVRAIMREVGVPVGAAT
ncbi:MAG TPA: dihydrodipicolinate synthase family protein [Planctomycetaceae bacterium]|nr:dihydrodipicolinate synthase family protein [Planctomycetaceae bacterium]